MSKTNTETNCYECRIRFDSKMFDVKKVVYKEKNYCKDCVEWIEGGKNTLKNLKEGTEPEKVEYPIKERCENCNESFYNKNIERDAFEYKGKVVCGRCISLV